MTPAELDALQEEQDKRDAIRSSRMARQAQPWISSFYEFERGKCVNSFMLDNEIVVNPVKSIATQQYLLALERLAQSCINAQVKAGVETEEE